MFNKSMWWFFFLTFALTIGGIQSLGWWTCPRAAAAQATQTEADPAANSAAHRHMQCQPMHWRSLVVYQ